MRARTIALLAVAAGAAAGFVVWRRRSAAAARPLLQLGLEDGAVHTLAASDPSAVELETLAASVRRALEVRR